MCCTHVHLMMRARGAQALLNCLMYKLSYYRFGEGALMATGRLGYDRVRQARPPVTPQLTQLDRQAKPTRVCTSAPSVLYRT